VLTIAACGGSDGETIGDALVESQGVARDFCSSVEVARTSMDAAVDMGSGFSSALGDVEATSEVVPDGAPDDVEDFFVALGEFISLIDDSTGEIPDENQTKVLDVAAQFDDNDQAVVLDFIEDECPDITISPSEAIGEMLVANPFGTPAADGEAPSPPNNPIDRNSAVDEPDLSVGDSAEPSASTDPADSSTDPADSSGDPAPTTEPPPTPATTTVLLEDGPVSAYEAVTIDIERVLVTDASEDDYFASGEALAGDDHLLLVEAYLEATTEDSNAFDPEDFLLTEPGGRSVAASNITDRRGDRPNFQIEGRTGQELVVVFPIDEMPADLIGWTITVDRDERIPQVIPFVDAVPESAYPLVLEAGSSAQAVVPTSNTNCLDTYDTEVVSATVVIESSNSRDSVERAGRNTRFVEVEVDFTNRTDVTEQDSPGYLCDIATGQGFFFSNVRLSVDGRPVSPVVDDGASKVEVDTTETFSFTFEIPADAEDLTLLAGEGEGVELGTWWVELEPVAGE